MILWWCCHPSLHSLMKCEVFRVWTIFRVATSNFFYLAQLVSLTEEFITSVILPLESCSHRAALIYLRESDGRKSGFPNLTVYCSKKKIWQFLMSVVHIVSFIWFAVVSCIIHCTNLSEYRFPFRVFLFKRMYILYKARYIRGTKCCASLYLAVSEHEYRN